MSDLLRGYCAGLFDGEGCIALRKRDSFLLVQMEMTVKEPVMVMQERYGGSVFTRQRRGRSISQPSWSWYAGGMRAVAVLQDIGPLLRAKREDLACVLPLLTVLVDHKPNCAYTPAEKRALMKAASRMKRLRARRTRNGKQ